MLSILKAGAFDTGVVPELIKQFKHPMCHVKNAQLIVILATMALPPKDYNAPYIGHMCSMNGLMSMKMM